MLDHKYVKNVSVTSIKDMIKKDLKESIKVNLIKSQAIKKEYMTIDEFKVTLKMLNINYQCWENSYHNKYMIMISYLEFFERNDMKEFIEDLIEKNNFIIKKIYNNSDFNDLCICF
jgi:hypothetical protein